MMVVQKTASYIQVELADLVISAKGRIHPLGIGSASIADRHAVTKLVNAQVFLASEDIDSTQKSSKRKLATPSTGFLRILNTRLNIYTRPTITEKTEGSRRINSGVGRGLNVVPWSSRVHPRLIVAKDRFQRCALFDWGWYCPRWLWLSRQTRLQRSYTLLLTNHRRST